MRNKKKSQISVLLLILLGLSIGFAALATTLKINGSTTITKNTWNIYWDNIANQDGVTPTTSEIVSEDANHPNNIVTFEVTFDKPGDYYEFTVDAVNAGTLDAEILSIEKKYNDTVIPEEEDPEHRVVPAYLKYEVTYADGSAIAIGNKLAKAPNPTAVPPVYTTKTYKIRVEYDKDAVTNADINNQVGNVTHEFSFKVDYGQAIETPVIAGTIPTCPECVFASVYSFGSSGLSYDVGDTLPLEIATSNLEVTSNNFEGSTTDYRQMRIGTKQYTCQLDDRTFAVSSAEQCDDGILDTKPDIDEQKKKFFGFKLDSNRTIEKKYLCGINDGNAFCLEDTKNSAEYETKYNAGKSTLYDIYGEYDDSTELGCKEETNDGVKIFSCFGELNTFMGLSEDSFQMIIGENYIITDEGREPGLFVGQNGYVIFGTDNETGRGTCENIYGCCWGI